ncbi:HAD family hydrolase [Nostoc sp. NIES-2111]
MIAAVLFDLDETLLDRTGSLRAFLADQHARFGAALGAADVATWTAQFLALDARGHRPKAEVYPEILRTFGGRPDAAGRLLADYETNCCRHARSFDGMADTLAALRARGLRLGIVTNGEGGFQRRHVAALGLEPRVDAVLVSAEEGLRKPDAALFRRAADRLGAAPGACLFVGDNPSADVLGASAAGMRPVWFRCGQAWPDDLPPNPGPTIDRLAEVLALV